MIVSKSYSRLFRLDSSCVRRSLLLNLQFRIDSDALALGSCTQLVSFLILCLNQFDGAKKTHKTGFVLTASSRFARVSRAVVSTICDVHFALMVTVEIDIFHKIIEVIKSTSSAGDKYRLHLSIRCEVILVWSDRKWKIDDNWPRKIQKIDID